MNNLTAILNYGGRNFVEFAVPMLIQSSVLIVILLAVDLLLRKKVRATFRYWLWMLVLVKLVLSPTFSSPVSLGRLAGDKLTTTKFQQTAPVMSYESAAVEMGEAEVIKAPDTPGIEAATAEGSQDFTDVPASPGTIIPQSISDNNTKELSWQAIVLVVWAGAAGAMVLLVIQRLFFVVGLIRQAQPAQGLLTETLEFCRKRMAVNLPVRLKVSANATSPAVCGLFRPVILVPQDIGPSLGVSHLRPVLMHELGHIKRGDLWVNLIQTVLQIIYFYNPLLWLANTMIRKVREQAVDEMVQVAMGTRAQDYPETLLNVAKLAFNRPALALRFIGVVESKSQLKERIVKMLNQPVPKSAKLTTTGLLAIICTALVLLPMARAKEKSATTDKAASQAYENNLSKAISVNVEQSPDGDRLTVQYAVMAVSQEAGIPYNWDKSAQQADPERRDYIEPVRFDNTTAKDALTSILEPHGLTFEITNEGLYLKKGENRFSGEEAGTREILLSYDDGKSASKWSFAGGGHGVKFTAPAKTNLVTAVRIYGSRYGEYEPPDENFDVWICDENFNTIENFQFPYSTFEKRGDEKWATLEIEPTKVGKNFAVCVAFDPHQTKGIYMYYDAKSSGHSYQGIPPEMEPFKDGDWLLRAVVQPLPEDEIADGPELSTKNTVQRNILANDDGTSADKWSFSGGGHGVKFTAPAEGCILKAVKLYGSRYGEYEAPKEDFDVWLCDKNFNIIKNFKFPYSTFAKRGYTKWATLKVDDVEVPKEFAICVAFDPHQTKGIYVYYDDKSSSRSYQGIPPEMEPFKDGNWMIRAVVETPGDKTATSPAPSQADKREAENLTAQAWKLWAERKLPEAEDLFNKAVEKDPTNANAWNGLGWAQQNQGKKENARYSFEKCLELEPMQAAALNGLGWIAKGNGQTDKAIEYWKKAVLASKGQATASLSGLTQTFMELEQYDQAIKYYEMWLKVEPNNEQAKQGLQQAVAKQ